jgi:hypothetical protein
MARRFSGAIFSIGDWKRNTGLPQSCCIGDVGSSARFIYKGATFETSDFCNASLRLLEGGIDHWRPLGRRCQRTRSAIAVNVLFPP